MQRIMVDLPEPDGPHTTTRWPVQTSRLMSFSTWNWPNHLCTPRSTMIGGSPLSCPVITVSSMAAAAPELPLDVYAVARHGEAEDPKTEPGEHVTFGRESNP